VQVEIVANDVEEIKIKEEDYNELVYVEDYHFDEL
jgi:hypothetical protein